MVEHSIRAVRVHGPGHEPKVSIRFGEERLHASGVFSNVYSAQLYHPVRMPVALKKTWPSKCAPNPGVGAQQSSMKDSTTEDPLTTARARSSEGGTEQTVNSEVFYLSRINHQSVIKLLYHFMLKSTEGDWCHCMVFDFLPTDMARLRQETPGHRFPLLDAKLYAFQMFAGIDHVNSLGIMHRDVKPSNMIVDNLKGILKLADFGNAKMVHETEENTSYQVTRYYRAPELIFGSTHYSTSIDIWACGCVLAEFATGKVLLQGRTRDDQARLVIDIFGFPTKEQCDAMKVKRPRFSRKRARGLDKTLEAYNASADLIRLVCGILKYEPLQRLTGSSILAHAFFDDLRRQPPPLRENGRALPKLDFNVVQQRTQRTSLSAEDESSESDEDEKSEDEK